MKLVFLLVLTIGFVNGLAGLSSRKIESDLYGKVFIDVIEVPAEDNQGFELIDVSRKREGHFASEHYDSDTMLVVNGGFFDGAFEPIGYFKIDGVVRSGETASNLSGFVSLDSDGRLDLHWKRVPEGKRSILQSGPFVIDPGGKQGILRPSGRAARRTLLGKKRDGTILVMTTSEVRLYELSKILLEEIPDLERALNLDGGPSTALYYEDVQMENLTRIANFIRKPKG